MRNLRLVIEYDGTRYGGWQRQKNSITIQQRLEEAIEKIVHERVNVTGAGRTDAGVHALGQVANFRTGSHIPAPTFVPAINAHLPEDIAVRGADEAPVDFHARYDARARHYRYVMLNDPVRTALGRAYCYCVWPQLDVPSMHEAAQSLLGEHDFSAFETESSADRGSVRRIERVEPWRDGPYVFFEIIGNAFLYNMVRAIVGTLIQVGHGKVSPHDFADVLAKRDRALAGPNVPACGLCLVEVRYERALPCRLRPALMMGGAFTHR